MSNLEISKTILEVLIKLGAKNIEITIDKEGITKITTNDKEQPVCTGTCSQPDYPVILPQIPVTSPKPVDLGGIFMYMAPSAPNTGTSPGTEVVYTYTKHEGQVLGHGTDE